MPRQPPDLDFRIHVDESCLSTPMEDQPVAKNAEADPETQKPETTLALFTGSSEETVAGTAKDQPDDPSPPAAGDADQPGDEVGGFEKAGDAGAEEYKADVESLGYLLEGQKEATEQAVRDMGEGNSNYRESAEASLIGEYEDTPRQSDVMEEDNEGEMDTTSRRVSGNSDRKTSLRTEALIQAAARAVVARIEEQAHNKVLSSRENRDSGGSVSGAADDTLGSGAPELPCDDSTEASRRSSAGSHLLSAPSVHGSEGGDAGDSSSHPDIDDDVFSDHSPRSSLGSFDGGQDDTHSKSGDTVQHNDDVEYRRSPRVSGISNLSQYENEDFVPTARGTPRAAFRTPSAVRALQMSSPTPSVFSSPRSSKRHTGVSHSALPTISRLGSPSISAQYSPKGRSTPPRFKTKKEAPLVLLHATVLPLRWLWADTLNGLDSTKGLEGYEPSEQLKTLRDAWRQLQDRVGDTLLERGVLLPHPQNDYEILEERLLEALELPLRRRARILECGHYLGPANETTLGEDEYADSDDEFASRAGSVKGSREKRHWCGTCHSDIRFDELGAGKIFRLKVYASNGLMTAGAWDACWKEMERVDAEVEPVVEHGLHKELERLHALQLEERACRAPEIREEEHHSDSEEHTFINHADIDPSSPPMPTSPVEPSATVTTDADTSRRLRDEARLREIYGHTPPPAEHNEPISSTYPPGGHPDTYIPPPSPLSPSEEAYERRQSRRRSYQTASLPELLLEAAKVVFRDGKNVAIALLSVFVLLLAVRGGGAVPAPELALREAEILRELQARHQMLELVQVGKAAGLEVEVGAVGVVGTGTETRVAGPSESVVVTAKEINQTGPDDVLEDKVLALEVETVTDRKVVRVYETVTETVKVTPTLDEAPETVVETVRITFTESVGPAQSGVGEEEKPVVAS